MSAIRWTPALAVGHATIDGQHQELIRRLNALLAAMAVGNRSEIEQLFEFLAEYVVEHFSAEEKLMQDSSFPGYNVHRSAHERFIRDYAGLRKLYQETGATAAVTIKAKTWLVDWLQVHIAGTDVQLARHLNARRA
ncbi:MAG: bacteriohemerythrin [Anaeromyxobacter sp.]